MSDPGLPAPRSRRRFLRSAFSVGAVLGASLLAACTPAPPAAQKTEAKPTDAPKPVASPAASPAASPGVAASPSPAASPAASPSPSPAAQAAPAPAKPVASGPLKLGLLVPTSAVYSQLGDDIADGMSLYLESVGNRAGGRPIEVIREDEGIDPQPALQKARKLIEQDRVDVFAGVVSTAVVYAIRDLLHNSQTIFVGANAGGNDLTRARKSPYIFRASFTSWQVSYPLGEWIAKNVSKKVFVSAADYGFGQESAAAFKENFTRNGGEVVGEVYPRLGTTDYAPFLPQIQGANPEASYSFYSGSDAVSFVKQYAEFGLKDRIKLTGAGFLVEEDVLPAQGEAAVGAISSLFWAKTLDNPENRRFGDDYRAKTRREPSVFAVQGYDTARVIVEGVNAVGGDTANKEALIKALENVKFASPRGPFEFDPQTHQVVQTMYIRETRMQDGKPTNVVIADLGTVRDPGA